MDLVAGLHWLRENLPAFNGNPNLVTLMGHGKFNTPVTDLPEVVIAFFPQ